MNGYHLTSVQIDFSLSFRYCKSLNLLVNTIDSYYVAAIFIFKCQIPHLVGLMNRNTSNEYKC